MHTYVDLIQILADMEPVSAPGPTKGIANNRFSLKSIAPLEILKWEFTQSPQRYLLFLSQCAPVTSVL